MPAIIRSKENEENFSSDDIREGLTAIISVKHPNPQYEGQTKTKLGNSEVRKIVSSIIGDQFNRYLLENPKIGRQILDKINLAAEARIAARTAKENIRRKGALDIPRTRQIGRLLKQRPAKCELYIVEGNSPAVRPKTDATRETQAILPLRGKILNVQKAQ
jgi:DNA gyrase subunit B